MGQSDFGAEGVVEEDRAYRGSRYAEVREAIFANPYQMVWGPRGSRRFRRAKSRCRAS